MHSDQTRKRSTNRAAILNALHREGPLQRSRLATQCDIRKASVTSIVADLLEEGLVIEVEPGRFRSPVALDTTSRAILSGCVRPSEITVGAVDLSGIIHGLSSCPVPPDADAETILGLLAAAFATAQATASAPVLGLGVAIPGVTDSVHGVGVFSANLPNWRDITVGECLEERFGLPVAVDHDVRCQLRAHCWFDAPVQEDDSILYVLVDDGVACAIAVHGRILPGARFGAGEIGHIRSDSRRRLCACGREDCLEAYCSLPAVQREVAEICPGLPVADAAALAREATRVPAVRNVLDRAAGHLARSLAGLVTALDPTALVLGASDQALAEHLAELLRRHLDHELLGLSASGVQITAAGDAHSAVLRGAAAVIMERSFL